MKNEKGITLVELLAVMVILTIITVGLYNVIIGANKQQVEQTEKNQELTELTYALKILTKDIRTASKVEVLTSSQLKIDTDTYVHNTTTHTIEKNGDEQFRNIRTFQVSENGKHISIQIIGTKNTEISTSITLRN